MTTRIYTLGLTSDGLRLLNAFSLLGMDRYTDLHGMPSPHHVKVRLLTEALEAMSSCESGELQRMLTSVQALMNERSTDAKAGTDKELEVPPTVINLQLGEQEAYIVSAGMALASALLSQKQGLAMAAFQYYSSHVQDYGQQNYNSFVARLNTVLQAGLPNAAVFPTGE